MLSDKEKLSLLYVVAKAPGGRSTQRHVAARLNITKIEARHRLRAAVSEGLIEESIDDSPSSPGRRVFTLSDERGAKELERLREGSRRRR